jgi:hypothetical protein
MTSSGIAVRRSIRIAPCTAILLAQIADRDHRAGEKGSADQMLKKLTYTNPDDKKITLEFKNRKKWRIAKTAEPIASMTRCMKVAFLLLFR